MKRFLEWLFTSRHTLFLEAEILRTRLDKDAQIRSLREEKAALLAKIEKLELAIWPTASRAGAAYASEGKPKPELDFRVPVTTFAQALAEHNAAEEKAKEN